MQKQHIPIKFSFWYAGFLYGTHVLAGVSVGILQLPVWIKLAGIGMVMLSAVFIPQKIHPVLELVHEGEDEWYLQTKTRRYRGRLSLTKSWISPYAAVLLFEVPPQKRLWPVVLWPDAVDRTILRQLAMYLVTVSFPAPNACPRPLQV